MKLKAPAFYVFLLGVYLFLLSAPIYGISNLRFSRILTLILLPFCVVLFFGKLSRIGLPFFFYLLISAVYIFIASIFGTSRGFSHAFGFVECILYSFVILCLFLQLSLPEISQALLVPASLNFGIALYQLNNARSMSFGSEAVPFASYVMPSYDRLHHTSPFGSLGTAVRVSGGLNDPSIFGGFIIVFSIIGLILYGHMRQKARFSDLSLLPRTRFLYKTPFLLCILIGFLTFSKSYSLTLFSYLFFRVSVPFLLSARSPKIPFQFRFLNVYGLILILAILFSLFFVLLNFNFIDSTYLSDLTDFAAMRFGSDSGHLDLFRQSTQAISFLPNGFDCQYCSSHRLVISLMVQFGLLLGSILFLLLLFLPLYLAYSAKLPFELKCNLIALSLSTMVGLNLYDYFLYPIYWLALSFILFCRLKPYAFF
jgi:hypothetical protein